MAKRANLAAALNDAGAKPSVGAVAAQPVAAAAATASSEAAVRPPSRKGQRAVTVYVSPNAPQAASHAHRRNRRQRAGPDDRGYERTVSEAREGADSVIGKRAFTLIELSIVLIIVGLVLGGVLVGRDLIAAAAARAQISQIEKYNQAVNTFKVKYGYLPGDIPEPAATRLGFATRGSAQGQGDGNGILEAYCSGPYSNTCGIYPFWGEEAMLWVDLSKEQLIDGSFITANPTATMNGISGTTINRYFPQSKIGSGGYVYVFSGGWPKIANNHGASNLPDPNNYFGIAAITGNAGTLISAVPLLTVSQAYAIDKKVDDGLPQSGNVMALTLGTWGAWASGGIWAGSAPFVYEPSAGLQDNLGGPVTSASTTTSGTSAGPTSCYDNSNGSLPMQYSLTRKGNGVNCSLSFQFQ